MKLLYLPALGCLFLHLFAAHVRAYETVVVNVPQDKLETFGDSGSDAPFGILAPTTSRYQQVYNADLFSQVPAGGAQIVGLAFRGDETLRHAWGGVIADLQVNLSTTAKNADSLSPIFAANIGQDDSTVFGRGSLQAEVSAFGGPLGARTFLIRFSHPFVYDPSQGNLLLDVRNFSGGDWQFTGSEKPMLDGFSSPNDGISRVFANDVFAGSATTIDTMGLFTTLVFETVPEPSATLVFLAALGLGSMFLRNPGITGTSQLKGDLDPSPSQ